MVFGGKYAHNTWWTDEPRQIKGINLLPMTTVLDLPGARPGLHQAQRRHAAGRHRDLRSRASARATPNPPPKDIWQDIFAKYLALADPAAALAQWDRWGSVEAGDTRTHTLHWMLSLQRDGPPDFGVTADTTLYAVFKRADGTQDLPGLQRRQGADQRALQRRQGAERGAGHAGPCAMNAPGRACRPANPRFMFASCSPNARLTGVFYRPAHAEPSARTREFPVRSPGVARCPRRQTQGSGSRTGQPLGKVTSRIPLPTRRSKSMLRESAFMIALLLANRARCGD